MTSRNVYKLYMYINYTLLNCTHSISFILIKKKLRIVSNDFRETKSILIEQTLLRVTEIMRNN